MAMDIRAVKGEATEPAVSTLVLASANPGKLVELRRLMVACDVKVVTMAEVGVVDEITEGITSYEDNARHKAETVVAATGLPALGEDSGLELLAMGNWPGPISHRWMGPHATDADRLDGLLSVIAHECHGDNRARFVTVVALARPGMPTLLSRGTLDGHLVSPRGNNGFGYDAAFYADEIGMTLGEAGPAQKDAVSHRARALKGLLGGPGVPDRGISE